jgi:hypothetical protein
MRAQTPDFARATVVDDGFPRSVAGEDYDRYARAMANDVERWVAKHMPIVVRSDLAAMLDAREALRTTAIAELRRDLYPNEERLLSSALRGRSALAEPSRQDVEPEIPEFLLS